MGHALEAIYPYVPVWAQNLGISLFGLAYRRERLGGEFDRYVAGFRERDRWSKERMEEYVATELRRVVQRAVEQVPYYRERLTVGGDLPVTPKADLRARGAEFVAADCRGRVEFYSSSGSTGTPVKIAYTAADHRRFMAAREARSFGWAGTSIRRPRSMIGGRRVVPSGTARAPFYRYNWAEQQVYFSAYHIAQANVADYVAGFNKYRPELLTGYAYSHYLLARMMVAQGLTLEYEPKAAVLSSEKLTAEMKRVIRQALRVRAFEEYGAVENCLLATECEAGRLHVSPDFGVVEIVDAAGKPVPPGVEGRVVCTALLSEAQPLIRYEIGDVAVWAKEECPCGRSQLPVLEEVVGRLEDVVVGPDGRELVRFHWVFMDLPNVVEGQVVQEAVDRLTLKLVTREGFGAAEERMIRERFAERLGPVQLVIERVSEIPRTERGKFRAVISKVKRP
ncbi:MAG: Phenylacetate-coenzyme A ligase [Verrucomicrobiae bacterium]|nr:Phenylacetate-coenzyme A ligase [Verrucomicrobiae bacterium]